MDRLLCSITDAGKVLGVGRSTVYGLIAEKSLVTVQIGRRRLVRLDSVRALVAGEQA